MSLWDKVTSAVDNVFDNKVLGTVVNWPVELTQQATGLKASEQALIGGALGGASAMSGASENNGLLNSLFGNSDNGGLLGTLFGSGDNNFLSNILGTVVKGAVGIGADYFSNQQYYKDQKKLNEQTFGHNRALAEEAYQRDVAMWNMQNAYNAPKEQMVRLQAAGMNPNLVYGSGNVTGNTAGSPPSYPQVQYPSAKAQKLDLMRNVLGIFDEYQQIKNQALDNQREAYRIALQERSLRLAEKREDNRDKQSERQFEIMLANLGLQQRKQDFNENKPNSIIGRYVADILRMFPRAVSNGKGDEALKSFMANRVKSYNNSKGRYKKGFNK